MGRRFAGLVLLLGIGAVAARCQKSQAPSAAGLPSKHRNLVVVNFERKPDEPNWIQRLAETIPNLIELRLGGLPSLSVERQKQAPSCVPSQTQPRTALGQSYYVADGTVVAEKESTAVVTYRLRQVDIRSCGEKQLLDFEEHYPRRGVIEGVARAAERYAAELSVQVEQGPIVLIEPTVEWAQIDDCASKQFDANGWPRKSLQELSKGEPCLITSERSRSFSRYLLLVLARDLKDFILRAGPESGERGYADLLVSGVMRSGQETTELLLLVGASGGPPTSRRVLEQKGNEGSFLKTSAQAAEEELLKARSPAPAPSPPSSEQAQALLKEGREAAAGAKYSIALGLFLRAAGNPAVQEDAWVGVGDAYFAQGSYGDAITYFQRGLETDPDNAEILNRVGHSHLANGDPGKALKYLYGSLGIKPEQPEAWELLGEAYGQLKANVPALRAYLQAGPKVPDVKTEIRSVIENLSSFEVEEALHLLEWGTSGGGGDAWREEVRAEILNHQGDLRSQEGKIEVAADSYAAAAQHARDRQTRIVARGSQADVAAQSGQYDKALELLSEARKDLSPTEDKILGEWLLRVEASALWRKGSLEQALDKFQEAYRLSPTPYSELEMGQVKAQMGGNLQEEASKIESTRPGEALTLRNKAEADLREAAETAEKLLATSEESVAGAASLYRQTNHLRGRDKETIAFLEKLAKERPDDEEILLNLGTAYADFPEDYERAYQTLNKLVSKNPNNLDYLASLLEAAALAEKYERLPELTTQILKRAQVEARQASQKKSAELLYKLLVALYRTWANVRLGRPREEELRAWRALFDEARAARVSFKDFWSFDEARKFLASNSTVIETQRNLLGAMIDAMENLGQPGSALPHILSSPTG